MSEATQSPSVEQTLNRTDLGHVLYVNRKVFFSALLAVIACVFGYAIWKQVQQSKAMDNSVKVFEFQSKTWEGAKSGKIPVADLAKAFENLDQNAKTSPLMVPVGLEIGKFLFDKGSLVEAEAILSQLNISHPVSKFFVGLQRSVILEKMGKLDEAIVVLEKLAQEKEGIMPAKVNLELGRLNLMKGEKGKAQTHFDFVVNNHPNDEAAKLAKLYLAQLAQ